MSVAGPLRLLWMGRITSSAGPRTATLDRFFNRRTITVNRPVDRGELSVYVGNPLRSIDLFAHEADRFASAAFESLIVEAPRGEYPRSIAWLLIRSYYAAFFALHALLRLHGWACSRLSGQLLAGINAEIDLLYPGSDRVDGGLYFLESGGGGSEITLKKMDAVNGGSHEMLWSLLVKYMTEVSDTALRDNTDPEANSLIAVAITNFLDLVRGKGGAAWFTQVRNRLNYLHSYGAWYPYADSTCDVHRVTAAMEGWRGSPEECLGRGAQDELIQFAEACAFIVCLCRITIEDLSFRAVPRSPFRSSSGRLLELARRAAVAAA